MNHLPGQFGPARRASAPVRIAWPIALLLAAFAVTTCRSNTLGPQASAVVGNHVSTSENVYFLPPIARSQSFTGTFDPSVDVEIHICEWTGGACADPEVAVFTMTTGTGSELVRMELGEEQYIVNWHTREFTLDTTKTYRIRVIADGTEVGHADVRLAGTGQDFRKFESEGYVALVDGSTLPIKVRIEQGAAPTTFGPASTQVADPSLALSGQHTCAVATSGTAYCWGDNQYGELGDGSFMSHDTPVAVIGGHSFRQVVTGYTFSCGLDTGGKAWCWGYGGAGALGNGTLTDSVATPVAVGGGHTFTQLVAGLSHVCGLTSGGVAYCWGGNSYGQLGDGTSTQKDVPTSVSGSLMFASLAAGHWDTCGVLIAGGVSCWGQNVYGQLGTGTPTSGGLAVPQDTVPGTQTAVEVITGDHSCARLSSGDVTCWGANNSGQLGRGTADPDEPTPALVIGGHSFQSLSGNSAHTCSLDASGMGWCWGTNTHGELGTGSIYMFEAQPVQVLGGPWVALTAGGHSTCGILTTGQAQCWGWNNLGQAGLGSTSTLNVTSPTDVAGGLTFSGP